jgi:uncharacterized repeat protein (TIGR02543 family)
VTAIERKQRTTLTDEEKPASTRAGYTFKGWFDENGKTEYKWPFTLTASLTMHAQWTLDSYDIIYSDLYGASNTNPSAYTVVSPDIPLDDPDHDTYRFDGWYDVEGEPVTQIDQGSTGPKTFYARWKPRAAISITLTVSSDPVLSHTSIFEDGSAQFSAAGEGYTSWQWRWDGTKIEDTESATYTLAAELKPPGVHELSVEVTAGGGQTLSARCRLTIKAKKGGA